VASSRRIAAVALCLAGAIQGLAAQDTTPPPTPEQLAAQERVRPIVNDIWLEVRSPAPPNEERPRYFFDVTDRLIAIGPDVVPFLVAEIDLMDPATFHFSAYALGRLGGPDAETALRKAIRAAEARGGRFGVACRRYALFGLALMGKPDALDLMQQGEPPLHGVVMLPDFPLASHLAVVIGPAGAGTLAKQLDTYTPDPEATDKLEDTLRALARAGDASVVPKLLDLLDHPSPRIRALAADAISRLGEPAQCERLIPLLASKDQGEKIFVASALERWKPAPCYKAMIGRLESEDDISVRGALYAAIVAIGGESSLDVFRAFLGSRNQFDQALVVDSIGRIGSKKGLNLLRSVLPEGNANTIAHALQGIANIGGEGAMDTLHAMASDRRRSVASSAAEILTGLGDKQIAPRRASEFLDLVREPIGNLSLRARVVELGEAMVTLSYTEPIDDLKAAAAVQTDLEILDTLNSCIRRLEALKRHGDDVAAWTAELASPLPAMRALADRRLAELGTPAAVKALTARLARTDLPPDEREDVFLAIGTARTAGASALVAAQLADPAGDVWNVQKARAAAAWAARRIGGPRMAEALRASAIRRDGRDFATLVYYAVLERGAARETLTTLKTRRLRYPESPFGPQSSQLDFIVSDLAAGYPLTRFDVAPGDLGDS